MLHENCVDYVVVVAHAHPNPQNIPSDGPCNREIEEKKIEQKNVKRKGTKTNIMLKKKKRNSRTFAYI